MVRIHSPAFWQSARERVVAGPHSPVKRAREQKGAGSMKDGEEQSAIRWLRWRASGRVFMGGKDEKLTLGAPRTNTQNTAISIPRLGGNRSPSGGDCAAHGVRAIHKKPRSGFARIDLFGIERRTQKLMRAKRGDPATTFLIRSFVGSSRLCEPIQGARARQDRHGGRRWRTN